MSEKINFNNETVETARALVFHEMKGNGINLKQGRAYFRSLKDNMAGTSHDLGHLNAEHLTIAGMKSLQKLFNKNKEMRNYLAAHEAEYLEMLQVPAAQLVLS
ncbi:MAG: hypothetical protein K9G62_03295 [Alphaproteobacteria bacterium]|nr:hypothetical protein [Alphaproteobacteria bacterium]